MILYFADRYLNILGQASTHLPEGIRITDDLKTEDVETGVSIFECDVHFDRKTRRKIEQWADVGNYILRSSDDENEFYQIIDSRIDTKNKKVSIYAEDDGLDLLNDVADAYEATEYHPISYYVEKFASGSGWEIGINEVEGLTRKLSWDSEQTASARLLSIAEAFNNCEISFSFEIDGLQIVKKYINIYEERGKDTGVQLRLNKEIDSIIIEKTISNIATALKATGGTPDNSEEPITLLGYEYDDGDFYVDGSVLKSRVALFNWSRLLWKNDNSEQEGGHIVKPYSYDTTSQAELCEKAIGELKLVRDMEVNYDIDISDFPDSVKIGDRVNIIDDEGELYLSSRVLILETCGVDNTRHAILGEHLIRRSGISLKVEQLAAEFAKATVAVSRALTIAKTAKTTADEAQKQADAAAEEATQAQTVADEAKAASDTATELAANAQAQALAAQAAVGKVEESVASLEKTATEAKDAAEYAEYAANTANQRADEARTAAENAMTDAAEAKEASKNAENSAASANSKAEEAIKTADTSKSNAEEAIATAIAAKLDAEQAEKDVDALGDELESVSRTMKTEYARKTDLTDTTADLQSQISQNAAKIESSVYKLMVVDETANNAASKLEAAQSAATLAQEQADAATAEAEAAQQAADEAREAANNAQAEADTAQAAYETARTVANEAEAALLAAKKDLATVSARADATEEEIAAAQVALTNAQKTADTATAEADAAALTAENALNIAIEAVSNADKAQAVADDAVNKAKLAQAVADEAQGNADNVKAIADEAAAIADEAQETANTAKTAADAAQKTANDAYTAATTAQATANEAQKTLQQANADLEAAELRLAEVLSNVDATAEEVEAAQADVTTAQNAANEARTSAEAAQSTADTAKADADTAQAAADEAKAIADAAQKSADDAQKAADEAQGYVYALAKRTVEAETKIKQNAEAIELRATKTEVAETLDGYYTKEETDAAIKVESDKISSTVESNTTDIENVKSRMTTVEQTAIGLSVEISEVDKKVNDIEVGGKNILLNSSFSENADKWTANFDGYDDTFTGDGILLINDVHPTTHDVEVTLTSDTITDFSTVTVSVFGKNLYDYTIDGSTLATSIVTDIAKNSISFKKEINQYASYVDTKVYLQPGTYWFSGECSSTDGFGGGWLVCDSTDEKIINNSSSANAVKGRFAITTPNTYILRLYSKYGAPAGTVLTYSNLQLELGSDGTEFEPYIEPQTVTANADGTVSGITSISPNMTFIADADVSISATVHLEPMTKKYGEPCFRIHSESMNNIQMVYQSVAGRLEPNTQYTMSGWVLTENIVMGNTSARGIRFLHNGRSTVNGVATTVSYNIQPAFFPLNAGAGVWTHFSGIFTTDEKILNPIESYIYVHARDFTGDVYFRNLKLEKGNKATDWTVAPEDIDSNITDASKTATNFLSYDATDELQVGNKQSGKWSGFRAQIQSAAFNILSAAGEICASYGAKLIELGKNDTDAIIKLCGGKGTIQYGHTGEYDPSSSVDKFTDYLKISSDNIELAGDNISLSRRKYTLHGEYGVDGSGITGSGSAVDVEEDGIHIWAKGYSNYEWDNDYGGYIGAGQASGSSNITVNSEEVSIYGPSVSIDSLDGVNIPTIITKTGDLNVKPATKTLMHKPVLIGNNKTGYNDSVPGWYFGIDGTAHVSRQNGGYFYFHYNGSSSVTSNIGESASGVISINGMKFGVNQILWGGDYALYMQESHTVSLSAAVSAQPHGIVLVFSRYTDSAKDYNWCTHFVPKGMVSKFNGGGQLFLMSTDGTFSVFGSKYLYIEDTQIRGNANNIAENVTGTCGITYNNKAFVLRYVIGV